MKSPKNIKALEQLPINLMGFIFYEKSPRNVTRKSGIKIRKGVAKVGVFVNASIDFVMEKAKAHQLDYVQLHGQENLFYCQQLRQAGLHLIKAFSVDENFSFANTKGYEFYCNYFLFDTKGKNPGGNGFAFDWKLLKAYKGKTPFFLSGGIGEKDADAIKELNFKNLKGLDLNSKFEIKPALKDIQKIKNFIDAIHS